MQYATIDGYVAWYAAHKERGDAGWAHRGNNIASCRRRAKWYVRYFGEYNWTCQGCKCTLNPAIAQIDHVANDGAIERKANDKLRSEQLAQRIVENEEWSRYQPLCANCNSYKRAFGVLPA
jgi:hypothetical protein